jgi:hypothetical protein
VRVEWGHEWEFANSLMLVDVFALDGAAGYAVSFHSFLRFLVQLFFIYSFFF